MTKRTLPDNVIDFEAAKRRLQNINPGIEPVSGREIIEAAKELFEDIVKSKKSRRKNKKD